jgi:general secretion pathway protein D
MVFFNRILHLSSASVLCLALFIHLHAAVDVIPSVTIPAVPQEISSESSAPVSKKVSKRVDTPITIPEEKKDIYLNFENTELANFIDYIAELKKLNIIPDKSVEGSKVSLTIREPLSITGAWNVFVSVLEMAGFAIVETGLVHKVVPKDKKIQQPLPAFINTPYEKLPDNDLTIRYVFFLSNIPTTDIQPLLESMLSQPNAIYENKEMNAFVITDKALNIRAAAKVLHELDSMGTPEEVTVMRLKRINAADAKALLDALIRKPETNPLARLLGKATEGSTEYFSATTRVIPEERSNSLILLGTKKSIDKIIDFISNHIDTELKASKSPLHIYELQHIDAKQVMEILKQVTAQPESATGQITGKYGGIRGGVKYFKNITFNVDKDGNRLIANCPDKQDWELIKKTIHDLDKPQPQVAIESMIVSITDDDTKFLGGALRNKKHGQIGKNIDFQSASLGVRPTLQMSGDTPVSLLGNMLGQIVAEAGSTVLSFGKENIWGAFQSIKTSKCGSVLEQPFITIANKTKGTIAVGSRKRVAYETQGSGDTEVASYKDVPAETTVEITPQINLDGIIRLDVHVKITDFSDTSGKNTSTQELGSKVTIADGQVLVLGGFIKTKVSENSEETPLLAKIPLLGWFFKSHERKISKQYIFIFLAPTIVKPREAPGMNLYTKMKLHQATLDIEDAVETKRTLDPIHSWYFNAEKENYSHKIIDFANARYQPTTVDIKNDLFYRSDVDEQPQQEAQQSFQDLKMNPAVTVATATQPKEEDAPATTKLPLQPEDATPINPEATIAPAQLPSPITNQQSADPLDAQRQELRRLLAQPIDQNEQSKEIEPVIMLPAQEPNIDMTIDPRKRNSLKEFLAASPATVQSNRDLILPQGG